MSRIAVAEPYDEGPAPADIRELAGGGAVELSTFFEVSLDLLVIRELDGRVVKVSRSWETALGYTPEEMQGTRLLPLVHPDDLPGTLESVTEVERRRPGDPVGDVPRDAIDAVVEALRPPFQGAVAPVLVAIAVDLTQHRITDPAVLDLDDAFQRRRHVVRMDQAQQDRAAHLVGRMA